VLTADLPRRRSDGERTHAAILKTAVRIASVEGIRGLTIGRLADATGISKSGLYSHFRSKEALQLQTIEAAMAIFRQEVMEPALAVESGAPRLQALLDAFFSYVERRVFPGGCFFAGLLGEEDARSGPVHDVVVAWERESVDVLAELIDAGRRRGEFRRDVDPRQLAFELYACLEMANFHAVLFDDAEPLQRGRLAVRAALDRARRGGRNLSVTVSAPSAPSRGR
jgi:AcrR family transcriptional regulator